MYLINDSPVGVQLCSRPNLQCRTDILVCAEYIAHLEVDDSTTFQCRLVCCKENKMNFFSVRNIFTFGTIECQERTTFDPFSKPCNEKQKIFSSNFNHFLLANSWEDNIVPQNIIQIKHL
jgi:hypothetical protein